MTRPTANRWRAATIALLATATLTLFFRHFHLPLLGATSAPGDFSVYLRAAQNTKAGANPYDPSLYNAYKYSPGALLPFLLLPATPVRSWMAFKAVCLVVWLAALLLGLQLKSRRDFALLTLGLILSWKGLIELLDYGNIEFIYLFGAVLGMRLLLDGSPAAKKSLFRVAASGAVFGALPWFKPAWALISLPAFLEARARDKKGWPAWCLGWAGAAAFFGALGPMLAFGPKKFAALVAAWLGVLKTQPSNLFLSDPNQSIWGTAWRWFPASPLPRTAALFALASICAAFALRALNRRMRLTPLQWATPWLILTQLLSPLGWRFGSMLLVGVPATADRPTAAKPALPMLAALLWLIQLNPVARALGFPHWTALHPYGTITLYWLVLLALCLRPRNGSA